MDSNSICSFSLLGSCPNNNKSKRCERLQSRDRTIVYNIMDGLKDSVVQMLAGEPVSINIGTFSNNMTIFVTKNNSDIT